MKSTNSFSNLAFLSKVIKYVHWIQRTEIVDNKNIEDLEKVNEVNDLEENSKKEILNNLEKLHDMVEDNDPNNQDQAVSEIMEEKVSDLYNELQENKFDIEAANMSMIDKAEVESKLDTTFVNEIVQIVTNEDETITGDLFLLCHKNNCGFSTEFKNFKANLWSSRSEKTS